MKIFGPAMKKRGSLQLSINAIVILILAITILGLGLGFIKKQFSSLGEQFESVSGEIKAEIINKIKQSGELLVFNKIEFDAQVGKPELFYVGVKNTGDDGCFRIAVKCMSALGGTEGACIEGISQDLASGLLVGGKDFDDKTAQDEIETPWFKLFGEVRIKAGEVGVYPVTLQLPGDVRPDTYLMELRIYQDLQETGCTFGQSQESKTYTQPKQFYIYVR